MSRLTESAIEAFAKLFEFLGYDTIYAPDGEHPERSRYDEVILSERLSAAVRRINPIVPHSALQEAVKEVERLHSPELLVNTCQTTITAIRLICNYLPLKLCLSKLK
ncbi:MAG: hypothetical protein WCS87_06420 [Methylococcaceae bacterium]